MGSGAKTPSVGMRTAHIKRHTKETDIEISLNVDGKGKAQISSGIPFLDHMLTLFSVHSLFDLKMEAKGDLEVDAHHTTEDIGISLGQAIKEALGDKRGIFRYGQSSIPMNEALAQVVVDLSGRPFFVYKGKKLMGKIETFDLELVKEFFWALSSQAAMTLHVYLNYGENKHHCVEAIFKAFGQALRKAVAKDISRSDIPSSKGVL